LLFNVSIERLSVYLPIKLYSDPGCLVFLFDGIVYVANNMLFTNRTKRILYNSVSRPATDIAVAAHENKTEIPELLTQKFNTSQTSHL